MKNIFVRSLPLIALIALAITGCTTNANLNNPTDTSSLIDVAQTSGQLATGTSFKITGSSSSATAGPQHAGGGKFAGVLAGTDLLAPTDQLLAIIDAETAGDIRGMRMSKQGGATVTNYDASGNVVTLTNPEVNSGGPEGCSMSGKQFPKNDSILLTIAKTVVDFGSGVTTTHGTNTITRSGTITTERTGTSASNVETVTFSNYKVNGALIEGVKTRTNTFDATTGSGTSATNVTTGKITFSDGTVATWTSTRERKSVIVLDSNNKPLSGEITTTGSTVIAAAGTVIYSHTITNPIIENIACGREHHGPVSGTVATVYNTDTVSIDFGDGTCSNTKITVTLNGVVTVKTTES